MPIFENETKEYLYSCIQNMYGSYLDGPFGFKQEYEACTWEEFSEMVAGVTVTKNLLDLVVSFAFQKEHRFFNKYNRTSRTSRNQQQKIHYNYLHCTTCKCAKIYITTTSSLGTNTSTDTQQNKLNSVKRIGDHSPFCNKHTVLSSSHIHPTQIQMQNHMKNLEFRPTPQLISDDGIFHASFVYETHPLIIRYIESNSKVNAKALKEAIKHLLNVTTTLSQSSLNRILRKVRFTFENQSMLGQYRLLPTILICLKKMNPGMTMILETSEDGTNSFHRMFIALPKFSTYVGVATLKIISADAAASRSISRFLLER